MGGLGFLCLIGLIFLRVPVAIAMGAVGIGGSLLLTSVKKTGLIVSATAFDSVFPYALSVIPLFIFMGVCVTHARISTKLYDGMQALLGRRPGGLAHSTIAACAMFGAICGSSLATAATMTRVALPQMRARGYDDALATGAIAAGGTLGILIPPSIILLIYGVLTGTSIGKLFIAGLIPGLVATLFYFGAVKYTILRNPEAGPAAAPTPLKARLRLLAGIWDVILLFGIVLGGIYTGWFSTIEAAAVGSVLALVAAVIRTRSLQFLPAAIEEAAMTTAMIFLIIACTAMFNGFIEQTHLPQWLIAAVTSSGMPVLTTLAVILGVYLLLGCFMDGLSIIFVTLPIVFPLVQNLGIDPVWFGILLVCATEIGLITPPIGMNLFVIQGLAQDVGIRTIWRGVLPFVVADILRLALLFAFPSLTLWLVSQMS